MPTALAWLSKTLSVKPVQGPLRVSEGIPNSLCYSDDTRFGYACCADQVLAEHKDPGVSNADYIVHVTARPFRGSVVAWAYPCSYDQYSRPISGQLNFVPSSLTSDPSEARMQFIKTLHELVHNLGFSSDLFPRFRRPGSLTQNMGTDATSKVYSQALQKTITSFVMSKTVAKLKEHFQCQNWPQGWGLELEDDGGGGTAGKHVEERILYNELMSGWVHENTVPSAISMAVLEDSGWYQVSYDLTEKLFWGNSEGCSFAQGRCSGWDSRYFCTEPGQSGCTVDMRSKATCNAYEVSRSGPAFESKYQYFADNPYKAGKFAGADYCPIFEASRTGDCSNELTSKFWYYGEYTGVSSRCIMGTFQLAQASSPLRRHGACAHTVCDPLTNRIRLTLARGQAQEASVLCPTAGSTIDLGEINSAWVGNVECPRASVLCSGDPCDVQDCNGHGVCQSADGSCICDLGFYGDDDYHCNKQRCPINAQTNLECSGHATCDTATGVCTDEDGLPGCFPGYKGSDCGTLGCPDARSPDCDDPSKPCECSGRGQCSSQGVCQCNAGYIASDCGLTDCPAAPSNSQRCGGSAQGACDVGSGVCQCTEGLDFGGGFYHFQGASCDFRVEGKRDFPALSFAGETDANGTRANTTLASVDPKAFKYFSFQVPSVQYDLKLEVRHAPAADTSAALPVIVASYETRGIPSLSDFQFKSALDASSNQVLVFKAQQEGGSSGDQGPSEFSDIGRMLVALIGFEAADVEIELSRDACAVLSCSASGTSSEGCVDNQCVCKRGLEQTVYTRSYGFTGLTCSEPDCPGQPDCGGRRGTCVFDPTVSDMPKCKCGSVFGGDACQQYNVPAGTSIFAGSAVAKAGTSVAAADHGVSLKGGYTRGQASASTVSVSVTNLNSSYASFIVPVGEQVTPAFVDPSVLGLSAEHQLTFYARLEVLGGDAGSKSAPDTTDPALVAQKNEVGSLDSFLAFDRSEWTLRGRVHEIVGTFSGSDYLFVSVLNGRYATQPMQATLFVEVAARGCPMSIAKCSGHGEGDCVSGCICKPGWAGLQCEVPAPVLLSSTLATTSQLLPGEWSYFVHRVADQAVEVAIEARPQQGSSPRSKPKLLALFQPAATQESLSLLNSEAAKYDFDAFANVTVSQSITLVRSSPSTQRYVILAVENMADASAPVSMHVSVHESKASSLPNCQAGGVVKPAGCSDPRAAYCSGKGEYALNNGVPFCDCDPGWDPNTRCKSPAFASLNQMASAAQSVEYMCSMCSKQVYLRKNDFYLFKSPQPAQAGAVLNVEVAALNLQGQTEASLDSDAGSARRLEEDGSQFGNPSLLISQTLPRGIADFGIIRTTRESAITASLAESSDTGKYFVAVYAHLAGNFSISMSRSPLVYKEVLGPSFAEELAAWLFASAPGLIVFIVCCSLFACLGACCVIDRCAPRCCTRVLAGRDKAAEQTDADLAENMLAYRKALTQPSKRSLGSKRTLGSRRSLGSSRQLASAVPSPEASKASSPRHAARPSGPISPLSNRRVPLKPTRTDVAAATPASGRLPAWAGGSKRALGPQARAAVQSEGIRPVADPRSRAASRAGELGRRPSGSPNGLAGHRRHPTGPAGGMFVHPAHQGPRSAGPRRSQTNGTAPPRGSWAVGQASPAPRRSSPRSRPRSPPPPRFAAHVRDVELSDDDIPAEPKGGHLPNE